MQIVRAQGNTVERVIRDKNGKLIRATFYVYESAGRIKARLVDFVYISEQAIKSAVFFLTGFLRNNTQGNPVYEHKSVTSPFLNTEILFSSGSKPRAPTF